MYQEHFLNYIRYEKRYSSHTVTSLQTDLEQFHQYLSDQDDTLTIDKVSHHDIRAWVVVLMDNGLQPRSINRKLSSLKTFFTFLMKKGVVRSNPAQRVVAPKLGKELPAFVQQDEMRSLLDSLSYPDGFPGWRDKMIIELLYSTGMRRSELINIQLDDVQLQQGMIKVIGKGNKERKLPFGEGLKESLASYLREREDFLTGAEEETPWLLITNQGKKLYPKFVYRVVNQYLEQVTTIARKSPHVLRHTYATHLTNNGADLNAVKELLGHASLASTQVYTHNSIEQLKQVYQQAHPKAKRNK